MNTTNANSYKASIIVVDDQPANLKLLEDMLRVHGYRVRSFPRGRLALAAAANNPPDLILLDINMPEMNGFEVCRELKSRDALRGIPVIFLSALNDTDDKLNALRCGGVDYITKPFAIEEVQARVETHLSIHRLESALREHNDRLEDLVRCRTGELEEANRRLKALDRTKRDFLALISHELRSPLNGLIGIGELVLEELKTSDAAELRSLFAESRERIVTILDDALLLSEIEIDPARFATDVVPISRVVREAISRAHDFACFRQVSLRSESNEDAVVVGTEELLVKAVGALIQTAVKFSTPGGVVRIDCHVAAETVDVTFETFGYSVPDSALAAFFDVFAVAQPIIPGGDLGLAAPVASRILSLFGGCAMLENTDPVAGIHLTARVKRHAANQWSSGEREVSLASEALVSHG